LVTKVKPNINSIILGIKLMVSSWLLVHCDHIMTSYTIVFLVKKRVHSLMCAGWNRDKANENRHLASSFGRKGGPTLQFVSSKSGTRKVYTIVSCIMVLVIKKVHSTFDNQAKAFVKNEWIDYKSSICGAIASWGI
jgi:hypothetical protein